jgi:hypothetical protein
MLRDKAAPRFRLMPGGLISARRGAEDDALAAKCHTWGVEPSAVRATENSNERAKRHKTDSKVVSMAKASHLDLLLAAGHARVAVTHSDPALAGKLVETLATYKVGVAVEGLVVRCGAATAHVDALSLAAALAPPHDDGEAPSTPVGGGGASAAGDADMEDAESPPPPSRAPASPPTPPSLARSWKAFCPTDWSLLCFRLARSDYARTVVDHPRVMLPEAEYPDDLRIWESPSGSGFFHPPTCVCGRPTCPVPEVG